MKLSEYDEEDLITELVRRGIKIKVHVDGVELTVYMGDQEMGNVHAK